MKKELLRNTPNLDHLLFNSLVIFDIERRKTASVSRLRDLNNKKPKPWANKNHIKKRHRIRS